MKTKLFLVAGVAMIASLVSCSTEEPVSTPDFPTSKTTAYAKVAISMPKVNGTRAEGGYDLGTEDENNISNIFLTFYDAAGFYIGEGVLQSDVEGVGTPSYTGSDAEDKNVEMNVDQVFKLSLLGDEVNDPAYVIAFINIDDAATISKIKSLSLDELVAGTTIDASKIFDGQGEGASEFAMTNSGYYDDNGNYVVAAEFVGSFYDTAPQAAAGASNAKIYVERLAAKMAVKATSYSETAKYVIKAYDSEDEVTLSFEPTFWGPTGKATEVNVVKTPFKQDAKDADENGVVYNATWMNKAADFRSFWAQGVNYSKNFVDYYNNGTTGLLDYVTYVDADAAVNNTSENLAAIGDAMYVPEHTSKLQQGTDDNGLTTGAENLIANTYAYVMGNYTVKINGTADDTKYVSEENGEKVTDFFLLLKGVDESGLKVYTIYNTEELTKYLLKDYNKIEKVRTTEDGPGVDAITFFTVDYVVNEETQEGKYALVLKSPNQTVYTYKDGEDKGTPIDVKTLKTSNSRHYRYLNGAAYFNVGVETETGVWGVVRNHSYVLNITKIENLGAPIDNNGHEDEDGNIQPDPIVPDPDDMKDHFIKAEINVLSWHAINNDVTL